MTTMVTITDTLLVPDLQTPIYARVTFTPNTEQGRLVLPEGTTFGSVSADTSQVTGAFSLAVPVVAGVLWSISVAPLGSNGRVSPGGRKFYLGTFAVTAQTTKLSDFVDTEILAMTASFRQGILDAATQVAADRAAVEALGNTNDTIIASRINDTASATHGALTAKFGRKVSLVVDAAGGGDYTTIAAALAAVPAGGADVLVKRGTYDGGFIVPSRTRLCGEAGATIVKLPNGANTNTIATASGSTGVVIEDLVIDGNKANNTLASGSTVAVFGSATVVRGCRVINAAGYGIVGYGPITGAPGATGADLLFNGNTVEDSAKDGIELQGASRCAIVGNLVKNAGYSGIYVWANSAQSGVCKDVTITGNTVTGPGASVAATGIRVDDGCENVTASGNVVNNAGTINSYGIGVFSSTSAAVKNVNVTGNTVTGANYVGGIYVGKAAAVAVAGNVVASTQYGIQATATVTEVAIDGNVVTSCTLNAINATGTVNVSVTSNMVKGNGGTTNDSIKIDGCTGVTVTGNRISDGAGGAGILLNNGTKDFTVTGNAVYKSKTSGIYALDARDGTISGNTCRANGQQGVGSVTSNGITLFKNTGTCTGIIVTGNRCYDDQGTKTQAYGVRLYGAVTDCVLGPNLLSGNATAAQSVDATVTGITTVTPV